MINSCSWCVEYGCRGGFDCDAGRRPSDQEGVAESSRKRAAGTQVYKALGSWRRAAGADGAQRRRRTFCRIPAAAMVPVDALPWDDWYP